MTERPNTQFDNPELPFGQRTALGIRENFVQDTLEIVTFRGEWTVVVNADSIVPVMTFLRDHWNYKMCHDVTSVDLFPAEPRFMVVYHLLNLDRSTRFRVKAPLPGNQAEIDSVVKLWPGANYLEREVYDLMGIRFRGHPDLRRILMPAEYEGHPLRKDFPLMGFNVGVDSIKE